MRPEEPQRAVPTPGATETVSRDSFSSTVANLVLLAPEGAQDARRWATELEADVRFDMNVAAMIRIRPTLLPDRADQWVVLADGAVVAFAEDFQRAAAQAFQLYPDGRTLVLPVDEAREFREPVIDRS